MTQAQKMPELVVSKVEVATVSIQTSPMKELKKEQPKRLSEQPPTVSLKSSVTVNPIFPENANSLAG